MFLAVYLVSCCKKSSNSLSYENQADNHTLGNHMSAYQTDRPILGVNIGKISSLLQSFTRLLCKMSKSKNDFPEFELSEVVSSFTTNDQADLNLTPAGDENSIFVETSIQEIVSETRTNDGNVDGNDGSITMEDDVIIREVAVERNANQGLNLPRRPTSIILVGLLSSLTANLSSELTAQPEHAGLFPLSSQPYELLPGSNANPNRIIQMSVNPQVEETIEYHQRANGNPQGNSPTLVVQENLGYGYDHVTMDNLNAVLKEDLIPTNQEPVNVSADSEADFFISPSSQVVDDQGIQPAEVDQRVSAADLVVQTSQVIQPEVTNGVQQSIRQAAESEISQVAQLGIPAIPVSGNPPTTPPSYPQADQLIAHHKIYFCELSSSNESFDFENIRWDTVTLNSSSRSLSPISYDHGQATFQEEEDAATGTNRSTTAFPNGSTPPRLNGPIAPSANIRFYYPESRHVYGREHFSAGVHTASHCNGNEGRCAITVHPVNRLHMSTDWYDSNDDEAYYSPIEDTSLEYLTPTGGNSSESHATGISVKSDSSSQQTAQDPGLCSSTEGHETAGPSASAQWYTPPGPELEPVAGTSTEAPKNAKTEKQVSIQVNVTSANRLLKPIAFDSQIGVDLRRFPAPFPTDEELYAILPAGPPSPRADRKRTDMLNRASQDDEMPEGVMRTCFCYLGTVCFLTTLGIATLFRKQIAHFIYSWFT